MARRLEAADLLLPYRERRLPSTHRALQAVDFLLQRLNLSLQVLDPPLVRHLAVLKVGHARACLLVGFVALSHLVCVVLQALCKLLDRSFRLGPHLSAVRLLLEGSVPLTLQQAYRVVQLLILAAELGDDAVRVPLHLGLSRLVLHHLVELLRHADDVLLALPGLLRLVLCLLGELLDSHLEALHILLQSFLRVAKRSVCPLCARYLRPHARDHPLHVVNSRPCIGQVPLCTLERNRSLLEQPPRLPDLLYEASALRDGLVSLLLDLGEVCRVRLQDLLDACELELKVICLLPDPLSQPRALAQLRE
mmetsp:Transcript_2275/g.5294  ORF Transcript_2275/g.5294 Transcript_2275/m.5294 type:complete len:307 (-) Transcript_2275:24-944(-)